jgi:hypothetical protein
MGHVLVKQIWRWVGLIVLWAVTATATFAQTEPQQQGKTTAVPVTPPKNLVPSDVKMPLLDQPLRLSDFADMQPREDLRAKLGHVENFIQNQPADGQPATEKTEVWMGHTRTALYFVFLCFDRHPELIRSHLARRENILKDDSVTLLLDPFQDRRLGVQFQVNAAGVQADAAYSEANGSDYSYDQVWDSEGRITQQGWMAMIVLPFRSVRFREARQDWGVVFTRNFPRNSESDWWPRVSTNVTGVLSQEGTLHGIQGVTGSHNVQINPYVLGQNEHELLSLDPSNPYFSTRHTEGTAGGEAKVIVKDSVIFDATVNPDFSDVESDQPQFTVNQRYPVYFPELRPFFLENANYFATPITLLYTRRIIRPEFGARITGKIKRTNLGLLAIDDRQPAQTVPMLDPAYGKRARFFVARVSEDVGKNSTVGLIYTDEEFAGGSNRVGGADFNFRLNDKWTTMGQMVESSTKGSRADTSAVIFPQGYNAGPATDWQLYRNGHAWSLQNEYQDFARGFATTSGFIQTANIRSDHTHSTYQWYPKHSVVQSYGVEGNQNLAFDHAGNRVYRYLQFDPFVLLPRNIVLAPLFGENVDTVGPQNGYSIPQSLNFTENYAGFVARGQPSAKFNFNVVAEHAGNVNYNPLSGKSPALLHQDFVQALFTLQPFRQLTADETYLLDRDHNAHTGAFVYENQVLRTKINYQFTRSMSARVIVEYDSNLANALETTLTRTKQVQTQALFTWLPHPGTAIYVGWNNDLQNLDHTICTPAQGAGSGCDMNRPILPRGPGYLNDGRQFFVKASYLLRF